MSQRPSDLGIPEMTTWCSGDLDFPPAVAEGTQLNSTDDTP
jgi:hypothetical protein